MTVRRLQPDDAAAFQALRLQGLRECPEAFASSYEEEATEPLEAVAARLVRGPDGAVFGWHRGDALLGVVAIQRERMRKLAHKADVWGMYVAPEARRSGVGRALLVRALAHATDELHVLQVTLGVNAANQAAVALYHSLGFSVFGTERGFLRVDGVLHDSHQMVWRPARWLEPWARTKHTMTRLRPMTSAEFVQWRAQSIPAYAADKVRSGRWSEPESLVEAEKELSSLLPQGLETAGHLLFTIESDTHQSVGALWLARAERPAGPIGYIYDLVIWPEHRRHGHAASAMRAVEREAIHLGFSGLALHVFGHSESARSLYAKLGYEPTNLNLFKPLAAPRGA